MGEVINYSFCRQKEIEQLNEREQELVRFLCGDYPNDENQLQRNYRLNTIKEFEDEMEEILNLR